MIDDATSGMLSPGWADLDVDAVVGDHAIITAALGVESALARCQARLGIIPDDAAETISAVADTMRVQPRMLDAGVAATSNPAITLIGMLQEAVDRVSPGTSDHVHLGATSQDILDTAMMIVCGHALDHLHDTLGRARRAVARLIERDGDAPMAGRTVSQHAVPITFGVKASAWLNAIADAEDDTATLLEQGLPLSLAGASGTLAAYQAYGGRALGEDFDPFSLVDAVAEELGLSPHYQPWHTVRTPITRLAGLFGVVGGALGKVATDINIMSRTEIGEVSEGLGEDAGVSSSMPQKRNPVRSVLILAAVRQLPACALVLQQAAAAEDERSSGAWQSEWQPLRDGLRLCLGAAARLVELAEGLTVDRRRMRRNLEMTGAAVVSERLNVALTPLVGKLQAKHILRDLLLADASAASDDLTEALASALTAAGADVAQVPLAELLDPGDYVGASSEIARRALARSASLDG